MSHSEQVVTVTIKSTGEQLEYKFSDPNELAKAYQDVVAHLDAYRQLKSIMLDTSMNLLLNNMQEGK